MRVAPRAVAALAATALLGGAVAAGAADGTGGTAPSTFDAVASVSAVRITLGVPGAPLSETPVDLGTPTAQSRVNSLGASTAMAALPYPGETLVSLPGLVAGLAGLPLPPYPLVARSDAGSQPDSEVTQPGVSLTAKSTPLASSGLARGGGDALGLPVGMTRTFAESKVDEAKGEVVAASDSVTEAVDIAGVLRIGRLHAAARAVRTSGKPLATTSAFEVESLTVAGVTLGVTDAGLVLAGSTQPVPDTSPLNDVLRAANVTIRYLGPTKGDRSIVSAGLEVTSPLPGISGTGRVTYTFGRAAASAVAEAGDVIDVGVVPDASGAGDVGAPVDAGGPGPVAVGDLGAPVARPSIGPAPVRRGGTAAQAAPVLASKVASSTTSASSIFVFLVIGLVVALGGAVLVRRFGVRLS